MSKESEQDNKRLKGESDMSDMYKTKETLRSQSDCSSNPEIRGKPVFLAPFQNFHN